MKEHIESCSFRNTCKFSENGCRFVGSAALLQKHVDDCLYQMIECPWGPCTKIIPMGEAVDHLEITHNAPEYKQNRSGVVEMWRWCIPGLIELGKQQYCSPAMATFDDTTVLLNTYISSHSWEFWVTHLGGEKQAQKCEVKMIVSREGCPTSLTFQGKVYGADGIKVRSGNTNNEKYKDGVLELSKSLMKKIGIMDEGKLKIHVTYELVRK